MNTVTSAQFVFCLTGFFLGVIAQMNNLKSSSSIHQESFVSANAGDNVTLHCFSEGDDNARFYWYKQTSGEKPRLIIAVLKSDKNSIRLHDKSNNDPRFTLDTEEGKNHLIISNLNITDSATYYCICSYLYTSVFLESVTVRVQDSGLKMQVSVQQSGSETIQSGGSETLNCTVHTGTCDGEHSVYWLKDSEESPAGLISTHGGRNDQCERNPNTQSHICVYNLLMNNQNLSHSGEFHCVVASCGHILFGSRTKLDIEDKQNSQFLVYFLSTALIITTIINALASVLLYKMNRSNSSQSAAESKDSDSENVELTYKDEDNLHTAALRKSRLEGERRQKSDIENKCVYSSVKLQS